MNRTLPPFPVDDSTLDLLEESFKAAYTIAEDGEHQIVGAEFNLPRLLDFLSGSDPDRSHLIGYSGDGIPIYEMWDQHYSERDVLIAMVAEVRRLRQACPNAEETP